jgi:hypothetical protein
MSDWLAHPLTDETTGVDFRVPDFERLIPNACRDLVSAVGMALSLDKSERLPAPFFHPDNWQEGWASVRVQWQVQPSGIVLPNGRQHAQVQIEVSGPTPITPEDQLLDGD